MTTLVKSEFIFKALFMNIEEIERFLSRKSTDEKKYVRISFKHRESIYGLFLKEKDYADLKSKNFWRIVPQSKLDAYNQTGDASYARIFNGSEFSKLSSYSESFETE